MGELKNRPYMKDIPFIDVDYCMFSDWGYQKPTRIWGCKELTTLGDRTCDGNCKNLERDQFGKWTHRLKLGCSAPPGKAKPSRTDAYRVLALLVSQLLLAVPEVIPPASWLQAPAQPPSDGQQPSPSSPKETGGANTQAAAAVQAAATSSREAGRQPVRPRPRSPPAPMVRPLRVVWPDAKQPATEPEESKQGG